MLLGWVLAAGALCLAGVAFCWGRAGRLSLGHATAWLLIAVCLLLAAVIAWVRPALAGAGSSAFVALLVVTAGLVIVALAHAAALTRLDERVRRLAQEVALLRAESSVGQAGSGGASARSSPAQRANGGPAGSGAMSGPSDGV